MGFKRQMVSMMISGKSPEEISEILGDIMPELMEKLGPHGMARIMNELIPQMMDACFSDMNAEQRRSVLTQYRSMLDGMEAKYVRS